MYVSVLGSASRAGGRRGVGEIDEDQTGLASPGTGCSANSNGVFLLLVHDNIVSTTLMVSVQFQAVVQFVQPTLGKSLEKCRVGGGEDLGRRWVDREKLCQIENLQNLSGA